MKSENDAVKTSHKVRFATRIRLTEPSVEISNKKEKIKIADDFIYYNSLNFTVRKIKN